MAAAALDSPRPRVASLAFFAGVTAALYLAREVLIPLALAVLFALLLAPAVRRLEGWRLNRVAATLVVVALALCFVAGIGWVTGNQFVSLVGKLPEYREHIVKKLQALRAPPKEGALGKAAEALKEIEKESAPARAQPPPKPPAPSVLPTSALEVIGKLGVPLLGLLATTVAVIALTILMLLQRDDLRERLIRLVGSGKMHTTTQAMQDAAQRVSRYLMMQTVVNASFGIPLGIILHFLGIPNAALWGLLATVLRFVPYIGSWIAGSMPVMLAFAISDGWSLALWTLGTIAVLETLVAYGVEPWLYGQSTGLSPLAIVGAVVFWSWLWGPIGLLVATPLTVCVAVIGRHVPQFGFLNVMLGVEPVLPPEARLYQRLLALEQDEALDVVQRHAKEHGAGAARGEVLIPALALAKRDRHRDALSDRRERFVYDTLVGILDELNGAELPDGGPVDLCIVPAHDEADYIAGLVLARELGADHFNATVLPHTLLAAEALDRVAAQCPGAVCISAVPPSGTAHASYLCKRLRRAFPKLRIIVAHWVNAEGADRSLQRLQEAGADEVVTRLATSVNKIRELIVPAALNKNGDGPPA